MRRGSILGALVFIVVVIAFILARGPGASVTAPRAGSIVDGFPLGAQLGKVDASLTTMAVNALDSRMPLHADIVSETPYHEDLALVYGSDAGRSGTLTVFVFVLTDGSYHATGVYCGVGGCQPFPLYQGR